ncbi:MCE family protein [Gandjariella thermophila]|uniref:ABC transporter substrate-binding protein n=1 Tax=Gandjariella thermophila TaxID=1931992 RepID=A0A4D4J3W0_9PSEU|nr:MCE family protein [Gandjariella thermophila]GDY29762.1 ABC transporter substrate-binding protein [Gandjariella thermophila]
MRGSLGPLVKFCVFATITLGLTGILGATIANTSFSHVDTYTARFTDATGLNVGDDVRIAGVKVGKVDAIELADRKYAAVRFEITGHRRLPAATTATIRYRNLVGQRYVALGTDVGNPNDVLRPGATIPADRTQPALNLTVLFNGFKPLFQALSPDDVNKLSYEIIQVLQGEGGTVDSLLTHTASLTTAIASKDRVIGQVIDNLTSVLNTISQRGPELPDLIDNMQQLVTGLAQQRQSVGAAISALGDLTNTTAGLLTDTRPGLKQDINQLGVLAQNLDDQEPLLDDMLKGMPSRLEAMTRTASYGSWFNYFACRMSGSVSIKSLGIQVPILPLPASDLPARCK